MSPASLSLGSWCPSSGTTLVSYEEGASLSLWGTLVATNCLWTWLPLWEPAGLPAEEGSALPHSSALGSVLCLFVF